VIVYLHGSPGKTPVAYHAMTVSPAGHRPKDCPEDSWWDYTQDKPKPREFFVEFHHGEAEVDESLGKYLLDSKLAFKSRLILPNSWGG
jgi:hypothetical protein